MVEELQAQEAAIKKKKKKRRKKNYILRLMVLIVAGVLLCFFLTSSLFDVQSVAVENNNYHTKEQIISEANIKTGKNIFAVRTDRIKSALLEDPYIKNARIKRSLPGTIVIIVEERRESAAIPYSDTFVIIDKDGLVLRRSEVEPKLPLLLGMTVKTMEEGQPLEVEETSVLTGSLKIIEAMESTNMFFKKIDISNVIVKAYIYDKLICEGTPENILRSMENGNLETLLYELYTKGIERGIINVGDGGEYPFSPQLDE